MIRALMMLSAGLVAGGASVTYLPSLLAPPAAVAPPPVLSPVAAPAAASKADLDALRQQVMLWKDMDEQHQDEIARQYSAMNSATVAIHNDLLRAEAERAAKRAQAASDARRLDFGPVIDKAQRATR